MSKIVSGEHEHQIAGISSYAWEVASLLWDNLIDIKSKTQNTEAVDACNALFRELTTTGWIGGIGKYPSSALKDIQSTKSSMPDHPESERILKKKIRAIQNCLIIERNRSSMQHDAYKAEMCKIISKYSGLNNIRPKIVHDIELNTDSHARQNYIMKISLKSIEYRSKAFSEAPVLQLAEAIIDLATESRKLFNYEVLLRS